MVQIKWRSYNEGALESGSIGALCVEVQRVDLRGATWRAAVLVCGRTVMWEHVGDRSTAKARVLPLARQWLQEQLGHVDEAENHVDIQGHRS